MIRWLFKLYAFGLLQEKNPKLLGDLLSVINNKAVFKKNKTTILRLLHYYKDNQKITETQLNFIARVNNNG